MRVDLSAYHGYLNRQYNFNLGFEFQLCLLHFAKVMKCWTMVSNQVGSESAKDFSCSSGIIQVSE